MKTSHNKPLAASPNLPTQLYLGGHWRDAVGGETIAVFDPSTEQLLAHVAAAGEEDVDIAVRAARCAFEDGPWSRMGHVERASCISRLADLLQRDQAQFTWLESQDTGNTIASIGYVDLPFLIASLRSAAGWADKIMGETLGSALHGTQFSYSVRDPVGVVGLITPWNAPLLMAVNKLAPALAMGCTAIIKPPELAPLSTIKLGELVAEAGIPDGVVNIIPGLGRVAGDALVRHPGVNKISFTGSTRVGKSILAAASSTVKRVTLELGGKSPAIVFADADIKAAAAAIATEATFKNGQYCAAGSRLLVHQNVADELVAAIAQIFAAKKLGNATAQDTELGPLISAAQRDRVIRYIGEGLNEGAQLVVGGCNGGAGQVGHFVAPTILANTHSGMKVVAEEIFGPVLCVETFQSDDVDAVATMANSTNYGLAAKIWIRDLGKTHRLIRKIQAGFISVNGGLGDLALPVGGFKQSGLGRECGRDGYLAYTEAKSVSLGY